MLFLTGWTGSDCNTDCGCNGHSKCETEGPGLCDLCEENTNGLYCQFCSPGSYGSATNETGCQKCHCNGHEDSEEGICDSKTGICFCKGKGLKLAN